MNQAYSKKIIWACFLIGFSCSILRHLPRIDSPFVLGRAGEFGGRFQGAIQEVWEEEGILAFKGRPTVWPVPTVPQSGFSYIHHPLLFHYAERFSVWCFGLNEFALRLYPTIGAAITAGLLALLACLRWRTWGVLIIIVLQVLSDGLFNYGNAANYDSTVTVFILGAFMAENLLVGRKRLALVFLCSFIGIGHEWSGGLIAFGLLGTMAYRRRFDWPVLLASLLGSTLYVAIHLALASYWEGSLNRAFEFMLMASAATGVSELPIGVLEFLKVQAQFFSRMWGYGVIPILFLPLLLQRSMASEIGFLKRNALFWLPIYVAWVGLFTGRSWNHEGWSYLVHPGVMLGQTAFLHTLFIRPWNSRWKVPARIAVLLLVSWGLYVPLHERLVRIETGDVLKDAKGINQVLNETDFVVTSRWTGPMYFYLNCSTFDLSVSKQELDKLIQRFRQGLFPHMKRFVLVIDRADRPLFDRSDFERRNPGFLFRSEPAADLYFLSK